jgi:RHS repeat-associated protein
LWDYRNRLTQVTGYDASATEQWRVAYVYDSLNRLVERTEYVGGTTTPASNDFFAYDGYQMVLKVGASGRVKGRTLWGSGTDQILATDDASGNVVWPLTDHLNTVRDLVSYHSGTDTTTLENHIVYDSFGEVKSQTSASLSSDFLFTARYTDPTTSLQWNLNRWYVPAIGRWASEDPIGFAAGDPNPGRYVGNQATTAFDPSGLQDVPRPLPPVTPEVPKPLPPTTDSGDDGSTCPRRLFPNWRRRRETLRELIAENTQAIYERLRSPEVTEKVADLLRRLPNGNFDEWSKAAGAGLEDIFEKVTLGVLARNAFDRLKSLGWLPDCENLDFLKGLKPDNLELELGNLREAWEAIQAHEPFDVGTLNAIWKLGPGPERPRGTR